MAQISTKTFYPPNWILNSTTAQALPHRQLVGNLILRVVPDSHRAWGGPLHSLTLPTACPTQAPLQEGAHLPVSSTHCSLLHHRVHPPRLKWPKPCLPLDTEWNFTGSSLERQKKPITCRQRRQRRFYFTTKKVSGFEVSLSVVIIKKQE